MSTYKQIVYQIVYSTKYREPHMLARGRGDLFAYLAGILKKHRCCLYQIGGIEDHLHIVTDLHPSTALAALIKDLKLASLDYIRREHLFPEFSGWQDGYGAFTYHVESLPALIGYVASQEKHHYGGEDFPAEYRRILQEHQVDFDERYLL